MEKDIVKEDKESFSDVRSLSKMDEASLLKTSVAGGPSNTGHSPRPLGTDRQTRFSGAGIALARHVTTF